uniref:Uncharacterized protein n=1 Tax=Triticum urartu TaxID=4572 RepID=A0A8R7P3P4_TRIUA
MSFHERLTVSPIDISILNVNIEMHPIQNSIFPTHNALYIQIYCWCFFCFLHILQVIFLPGIVSVPKLLILLFLANFGSICFFVCDPVSLQMLFLSCHILLQSAFLGMIQSLIY